LASFHVVYVRTCGNLATNRRTAAAYAARLGAVHGRRRSRAARVLERDVRLQPRGRDRAEPRLHPGGLGVRRVPRHDEPRVAEVQRAQPRVGERGRVLVGQADRRRPGRRREGGEREQGQWDEQAGAHRARIPAARRTSIRVAP
jgi:hypothetical protein